MSGTICRKKFGKLSLSQFSANCLGKLSRILGNNLPKKCLKVLLHALVLSHFEYCNLLLTDISSALLLSLEKQLNWALKTVFYRSRNKCSTSLRISEEILGMKHRIDLKSFDFLFLILKNERSAFQIRLKLPTMIFRINDRNKKNIERAWFKQVS